jgi:carbon-monoxide dehydrogenase medium subunit
MIPGAFDYHRPSSLDEALRLLAQYGDDGRLIAGGHSLIPMMRLRLAQPAHLVDLGGIAGLSGVCSDAAELVIGALTTQHDLLASDLVRERCPLLHETAELIADPQVRYRGTVGGNVANGDPGNDMPAVMQCLDATYVVRGPKGERRIRAREFYEAAYFTKLAGDEILIAIRIPGPPIGHGWAYEKQKRKVGDYATAAAAVILALDGGRCASASVALTNLGPTPIWVAAAGTAVVGTGVDDAAIAAASAAAEAACDPAADMRGPADYRRHLAGIMTERALRRALARARSH